MSKTKIPWAERVWNPLIGCKKASAGCLNCYAEKMAARLCSMGKFEYLNVVECKAPPNQDELIIGLPKWNGKSFLRTGELTKPGNWKTPRVIFVCSMSDLFYEGHSFEDIDKVFDVMMSNPKHHYLILTKRPEQALEYFKWQGKRIKEAGLDSVPTQSANYLDYLSMPPFIWLGVTIENQDMARERIPKLFELPVFNSQYFVSVEPMLGFMDISKHLTGDKRIKWVICGAESGPNEVRRLMRLWWIESLRDQCETTETLFFFKQAYIDNKRVHMPELDGKVWNQSPFTTNL